MIPTLEQIIKEHIERMSYGRIPKFIIKYQPRGRRLIRRSLKGKETSVF
jgi:hypothetical protein